MGVYGSAGCVIFRFFREILEAPSFPSNALPNTDFKGDIELIMVFIIELKGTIKSEIFRKNFFALESNSCLHRLFAHVC